MTVRPGSRGEVVVEMRRRVEEALASPGGGAGADGAGGGGAGADGVGAAAGDRPWLGLHQVAQVCPARAFGPRVPYAETAAGSARRVGLVALREHPGRPPVERVSAALESTESFAGELAGWLRGLDRAGRAAVRAAATAWVVDTLALAHRGEAEPAWQGPRNLRFEPRPPAPVLTAPCDATRVTADGRLHLYLTRPGTSSTDGAVAAHVAMVWALAAGQVPASVVIGHRDSLARAAFPMGDDEMDAALETVARQSRWALDPAAAPARPGPGCTHCHLRDGCDEGTAWAAAVESGPVAGSGPAPAGGSVGQSSGSVKPTASAPGDEPTM